MAVAPDEKIGGPTPDEPLQARRDAPQMVLR